MVKSPSRVQASQDTLERSDAARLGPRANPAHPTLSGLNLKTSSGPDSLQVVKARMRTPLEQRTVGMAGFRAAYR